MENLNREEGQTLSEYAVVLTIITIGIVVLLTALSASVAAAIGHIVTSM